MAKKKAAAKEVALVEEPQLELRVEVSVSREQRALGPNITLWENTTNQPVSTKAVQVVILLNSSTKEIEDTYLAPLPLGATEDVVVYDTTTYRRPSGQIECVGGAEPRVSVRGTYEDLIKFCEVDLARQYADMHAQAVQDFRAEFTGDVVTDPSEVDLGSINAEELEDELEVEDEAAELEELEESLVDNEDIDSLEEDLPFEIDDSDEIEEIEELAAAENQSSDEDEEEDIEELEEEVEDFDDDDEIEEVEEDGDEIEEVEDDIEEIEEVEDFDEEDDEEVEEVEEVEDFDEEDDDEIEEVEEDDDEIEEVEEDDDDDLADILSSFDALPIEEARNIAVSVGVSPLVAKKAASVAKLKKLFREKVE